jgi:uncharacterized protein YbaR (Trm112 family)
MTDTHNLPVAAADERSPVGKPDRKMLEMLICPLTRTVLEYDAHNQELISRAAHMAFPIRDGIPVLLPEEARILQD